MAIDVYDDLPPSPTLTNPDMILPSRPGDSILSMSMPGSGGPIRAAAPSAHIIHYQQQDTQIPRRVPQRLQDLSDPRLAFSNFSSYGAPPISPARTSPGIAIRPSSPIDSVNESSDTTPTRRVNGSSGGMASTSALHTLGEQGPTWPVNGRPTSGLSNASSSEHSDDLEQWAARRATLAGDGDGESVVTMEDDEDGYGKNENGETKESPSANKYDPDDDFLSRRAEIILANAKSRLKMMEGNLKGARYSLSSNSLSNRYSFASSKAGGVRSSTGHSRATSEVSMPSVVPPVPTVQAQSRLPKRSSSALGTFGSNLQVVDRSGSLRGARSQEAMRENRLKHWIMDERDRSASTSVDTPQAASINEHHGPAAQNGSPTPSDMRRPVSQASSIRAQMNELKGRIYEIKERAKESGKRNSSIGQRSPSPQAPSNNSSSPKTISHTAGPGPTIEDEEEYDEDDEDWLGASEVDYAETPGSMETTDYEESHYEDAEETLDDLEGTLNHQSLGRRGYFQHQAGDPLLLDGVIEEEEHDDYSESGATEYYEADQVVAERHEDRFDAFDYSNMFLHSAMSSAYARRDSYSSESSVETTRPVSPLRVVHAQEMVLVNGEEDDLDSNEPSPNKSRLGMHSRSMSSNSVSSIATFETAAEGQDAEDEDDDDEEDDNAISRDLQEAHPEPKLTVPRPEARAHSHQGASTIMSPTNARASVLLGSPPSFLPSPPAGASMNRRSSQNMRPSSGLLSSFIGLDSVTASPEAIQKDRALIENVVGALQRCCLELQRAPEDRRAVLRERLADTKRQLIEVLEVSSPRPTSSGRPL